MTPGVENQATLDPDRTDQREHRVQRPGLAGRMSVVEYMNNENTPFYRLALDVLLDEESRLGLHLSTAEIERRMRAVTESYDEDPGTLNVDSLLNQLYEWGNVDRIHNTHRKGTYQEYLKRDFLYQLTPAGAEVHRALTRIDIELGSAGALQSSMLPEVLSALYRLVEGIDPTRGPAAQPASVYGTLQRIINGFTQLSENAKLFVQGLNRALEPSSDLSTEVFLAYKDVVVEYLQTFVMALMNHASPIAQAIQDAEDAGITSRFRQLAALEAAPVIGMSQDEVIARDTHVLYEQWDGLRGWFFGTRDRPPVAQTLQDRAADAVNRIVATIRRLNEHRFRRLNRAADLLTLAVWFSGTDDATERATMWRAAFGMYSARHFGTAHAEENDLDSRPKASWWETPPAPVSPRLRTQGPRAAVGRPSNLSDPRSAKQRLAVQRTAERAEHDEAIRRLVSRGPVRLSQLSRSSPLSGRDLDLLLSCLAIAMSARPDANGQRTGRTSDGRLHVRLRRADPALEPAPAIIRTDRGDLAAEDFELTVTDLHREGR